MMCQNIHSTIGHHHSKLFTSLPFLFVFFVFPRSHSLRNALYLKEVIDNIVYNWLYLCIFLKKPFVSPFRLVWTTTAKRTLLSSTASPRVNSGVAVGMMQLPSFSSMRIRSRREKKRITFNSLKGKKKKKRRNALTRMQWRWVRLSKCQSFLILVHWIFTWVAPSFSFSFTISGIVIISNVRRSSKFFFSFCWSSSGFFSS